MLFLTKRVIRWASWAGLLVKLLNNLRSMFRKVLINTTIGDCGSCAADMQGVTLPC